MREAWGPRIVLTAVLGAGVLVVLACGLDVTGTLSVTPETADATTADAPSASDASDASDALAESAESADAPAGDTGSASDAPADALDAGAPPDARDAAVDGPKTFCQTLAAIPTFCADFDDPADASPSAGWDDTIVDAGASLALSTTTYKSAPRACHAVSTQGSSSSLVKEFPLTSKVSVELDVLFTSLPASGEVSPIRLTPPAFPGMDVYWYVHTANSYFQEYGDDYSPMLSPPTLNVWHHVTVSIAVTSGTSTINAGVDGTAYWTNHVLLHPWPTPTTAILEVGLGELYALQSAEAFVDNVVVTVQ